MTQPISRDQVLQLLSGAGEIPPPEAVARPAAGGSGFILEDIERLFQFFERAEPLFEKFSARIMQIREFEGHAPRSEDEDGEVMYLDAPERQPERAGPASGARRPQGGQPGRATDADSVDFRQEAPISSIKVYQFLCGMLAQLPKDQTIGEAMAGVVPLETTVEAALGMVRDYKAVIMAVLDEQLKDPG